MPKFGGIAGGPPGGKGGMGKQAGSQMLPHRNALTLLTKGDPVQRSLGNYSKLSPGDASGLGEMEQPNFTLGLPGVTRR